MRYDYIDLCKRLAAWYGGKLELVGLDPLVLYEHDAEHSEFVRAIIWKSVELDLKTNNQDAANNGNLFNDYAIYGYSALVGIVDGYSALVGIGDKGNKAACKGLLKFLLTKTWSETDYGTWPARIYDKGRQFKQNWLKFDDLRMLDVELTLRGF